MTIYQIQNLLYVEPSETLLRAGLAIYWIVNILIILSKPFVRYLDVTLTYGKLENTTLHKQVQPWWLPSFFLSPRVAWSSFYCTGIISWIVCVTISSSYRIIPSSLLLIHISRRLCECLLVHRFSNVRTVPFVQTVAGCLYYVMAPMTLVLEPPVGQTADAHSVWDKTNLTLITVTFLLASLTQNIAHRELANAKPIVGKYGIPRGFLFKIVLCPHYLSEVVIYFLFALHLNTVCVWLVFIFVLTNLSDTALRTVSWYQSTFKPHLLAGTSHWGIIPFIM